jgi:hypothetical protein
VSSNCRRQMKAHCMVPSLCILSKVTISVCFCHELARDDITPLLASHQRDGILEGTKSVHLVVDGSKEPLSGIVSYISVPVATFK